MSELRLRKLTSWPPATLEANTIYAVSISATETEMYITSAGPTVTARKLVDSNSAILRTAGDSGIGAIRYAGTTRTAGQLYGGTTNPSSTTRLNYDGDLVASTFYSEEIILNLSSLNTDVTVKTFNTTDKFIFIVSAQPTGNITASAAYSAHKGHDGTNSVFRLGNLNIASNIALNADLNGSTLRARATGSNAVNAEIKVTILYLNRT